MSKRNWVKHDAERDRLMAMVPKELPEAVDSWLDNYCLNDEQFIFYDRKDHYAFCTRCQQMIDSRHLTAMHATHREATTCPICGKRAEFRCMGRYHSKYRPMTTHTFQFMIMQSIPEGVLFRRFEMIRQCNKRRNQVEIAWGWNELQRIFNDGITIKRYRKLSEFSPENRWTTVWKESKKSEFATVRTLGYVITTPSFEYTANSSDILSGPIFKYAKAGQELEYYAAWIRPIEYLEKLGWSNLCQNIMNHRTTGLKLKASSPDKMLQLPKNLVKYACQGNLDVDDLSALRTLVRQGAQIPSVETLLKYSRHSCYYQSARRIAPAITMTDFMKFMDHLNSSHHIYMYADYLTFCVKLGYDMTSPDVLYPRDIKDAHDREMNRIKMQENEKQQKAIASRFTKDQMKLGYQAGNLMIRPPKDMSELLQEGSKLGHCVGTYADRVAERKTTILFVRHSEEPDEPFYTLEWRDNKIIQCRGHRNKEMTEEVKTFIDLWKSRISARPARRTAVAAR